MCEDFISKFFYSQFYIQISYRGHIMYCFMYFLQKFSKISVRNNQKKPLNFVSSIMVRQVDRKHEQSYVQSILRCEIILKNINSHPKCIFRSFWIDQMCLWQNNNNIHIYIHNTFTSNSNLLYRSYGYPYDYRKLCILVAQFKVGEQLMDLKENAQMYTSIETAQSYYTFSRHIF